MSKRRKVQGYTFFGHANLEIARVATTRLTRHPQHDEALTMHMCTLAKPCETLQRKRGEVNHVLNMLWDHHADETGAEVPPAEELFAFGYIHDECGNHVRDNRKLHYIPPNIGPYTYRFEPLIDIFLEELHSIYRIRSASARMSLNREAGCRQIIHPYMSTQQKESVRGFELVTLRLGKHRCPRGVRVMIYSRLIGDTVRTFNDARATLCELFPGLYDNIEELNEN
jgi:hypothetical protein